MTCLLRKRANSFLNVDQSNFLRKNVTLILGLYVYNIIQINLRAKQNCKIFYCSLKEHMNI